MTHYQCPECDKEGKTAKEVQKNGCKCKIEPILYLDYGDHNTKNDKLSNKPNKRTVKKVKGHIQDFFVESIVIDGKPSFLCCNLDSGLLSTKHEFEVDEKIIKPLDPNECGYIPYEFTQVEIDKAINNKLDKEKILDEIKRQIDRFVVVRDLDKHLILGDLMLSYEQEHINTVHFPFFVGETESGKSSVVHLFRLLSYRCLYGEDIPNADIYNFLGTEEECAGTIAEDEAQDIWKNRDKLKTYKNSYSKGSVKPRIITTNFSKNQVYYKTFCLKAFAGERIPEDKGFRERLAIVYMLEGSPESNIKRQTSEEKHELLMLRNALLVYKVQNVKNDLPKINSGLKQRDQELWEDFLAVVYDTKYYEKCLETVAYHTKQRHESIWNSLEARIFKIIKQVLDERNEIRLEAFWDTLSNIQDILPGTLDKETFYPHDFSTKITRNYLSRLFEDKFQAKRKQNYNTDDNKKKHLVTSYWFKEDVINVLTRKYNIVEKESHGQIVLSGHSDGSGNPNNIQNNNVDHVDNCKDINGSGNNQNERKSQQIVNSKGRLCICSCEAIFYENDKGNLGTIKKYHENQGHQISFDLETIQHDIT